MRAVEAGLHGWRRSGGDLSRFLADGAVSVDDNDIENLMRPLALGRKAWPSAGSEFAGSARRW